jgi:preprotein translocase subunit SecF
MTTTRAWNIIGNRRWGYLLSALIIIPGIIALVVWGLDLGIDFTGGTLMDLRLGRDASVSEIRAVLATFGHQEAVIQKTPEQPNQVLIRTAALDEPTVARIQAALGQRFGGVDRAASSVANVGPQIGRELRTRAVTAVLIGLVLQLLYISWRFRSVRFALTADVALFHDLLIVVGLFALLRKEIDSAFVAVLLTVIGYSVNDTVVIFDRIRDTLAQRLRLPFAEMVNRSILEVLVRSLTTGIGAVMAILAIYVFGGVTIRDFALGLGIAVITGTYSSIFVASPLLVDWENWSERRAGRAAGEAARLPVGAPESERAPERPVVFSNPPRTRRRNRGRR